VTAFTVLAMSKVKQIAPAFVPLALLPAFVSIIFGQATWTRKNGVKVYGPDLDTINLDGPGQEPLRITWLGDSLAAGVGASDRTTTLAYSVASAFSRTLNRGVETTVLAVSGATVKTVVKDQLPKLKDLPLQDIVVLCVGANDIAAMSSRKTLQKGFKEIFSSIDAPDIAVVGIPSLKDALRFPQPLRTIAALSGAHINSVLKKHAKNTTSAIYIDIAKATTTRDKTILRNFLASDLYHPNSLGYGVWADHIFTTLLNSSSFSTVNNKTL